MKKTLGQIGHDAYSKVDPLPAWGDEHEAIVSGLEAAARTLVEQRVFLGRTAYHAFCSAPPDVVEGNWGKLRSVERKAWNAFAAAVKAEVAKPSAPKANPVSTDEDILEEALRITSGDRQNAYGPADQDFKRTAAMWSALKGVEFTARDVALFMICLKCSRETHQRKRDNWVDIAGYARCGSKCTEDKR